MQGNNFLEVLSPVGDTERFNAALKYGADAVYLGRKSFGMRSSPMNFDYEQLISAVNKAHEKGVKVYLTCNTLPRNNEIPEFQQFIEEAVSAKVDAVIVADIGLMALVKKFAPDMEIHMSTQTGIVNYVTATELYNMGAKRVVLARELSLEEIAEIRAKSPKDMEIEVFVHGAMCVSFSGRCLLSQYLVNRDANRGECAQPCRWSYHLMEEKRTDQFFPVFEDEKGTYILNAKDLCMIHQFEKQEMIVVCKPEDSMDWFHKLYSYTVEFFRTLDIPVRTLECCSGDLADLKVKSIDVEAWSPRQKKYFEVGSCSNLGDAQARRLGIRVKGSDGEKYFAHTLNNTVVAPPRMLIAFLENNINEDGSIRIPEALRYYMRKDKIEVPKK